MCVRLSVVNGKILWFVVHRHGCVCVSDHSVNFFSILFMKMQIYKFLRTYERPNSIDSKTILIRCVDVQLFWTIRMIMNCWYDCLSLCSNLWLLVFNVCVATANRMELHCVAQQRRLARAWIIPFRYRVNTLNAQCGSYVIAPLSVCKHCTLYVRRAFVRAYHFAINFKWQPTHTPATNCWNSS